MESVIAFVLILGVLVWFHEFGHFATARLVGMRVEEFAFGWGPKLFSLFRRKGTDYTIHAIPLGGFVKIAGMEPGQEDIPDGYQAQSAWKRALVIFSGPFMSFVLGVLVFVLVGVHWGFPDPFSPRNQIGMVYPKTEAARMGLRAGDEILEIDGVDIRQGLDMVSLIHEKPGKTVRLVVQRDKQVLHLTGIPKWRVWFLDAAWSFMGGNRAVVEDGVTPDTPGGRALMPGDTLLAINGKTVRGGDEMVSAIAANEGKQVRLDLLRGGNRITRVAAPSIRWVRYLGAKWGFPGAYLEGERDSKTGSRAAMLKLQPGDMILSINSRKIKTGEQMVSALTAAGQSRVKLRIATMDKERTVTAPGLSTAPETAYYEAVGLLGFTPAPSLRKTSFAESVKNGVLSTAGYATQMVKTLTSKKRLKEDVGGPVMIAKATADSVALGPYWVFMELGMLSLSLAFINLLPIPILDGGHLAIIAVESVRRKRLTLQQMATVQAVGLAIIAMLIVVVLFSDISKILGGNVPQ